MAGQWSQFDTDELGNVIWEYRPEQEKKVLYTAHLDTVFSLEEPLEIKKTE